MASPKPTFAFCVSKNQNDFGTKNFCEAMCFSKQNQSQIEKYFRKIVYLGVLTVFCQYKAFANIS